jgi:uncharacterized protein YqeY
VTLRERLKADTTAAMRSGDALRRDTLRMAQSSIYNAEKAKRVELSEDEVLGLLAREVKTRRESVEAFRSGGRVDLAAKEEAEIAILQGYLPRSLSDDELRAGGRGRDATGGPAPATWARSWAGSHRASAVARTARPPRGWSPRRSRGPISPPTKRGTDLRSGGPTDARSDARADDAVHPPRRGAVIAASVVLVAAMSVILGLDFLPAQPARGRQARARPRPGAAGGRVRQPVLTDQSGKRPASSWSCNTTSRPPGRSRGGRAAAAPARDPDRADQARSRTASSGRS